MSLFTALPFLLLSVVTASCADKETENCEYIQKTCPMIACVLPASTASQAKMGAMVPREKRENQVQFGLFFLCNSLSPKENCLDWEEGNVFMPLVLLSTTYSHLKQRYSSDSGIPDSHTETADIWWSCRLRELTLKASCGT